MAATGLSLRVRIFLFFAILMVASPLSVGVAIWLAHQADTGNLTRLLVTYTGVSAIVMLLITTLVWQLFDRHIGSALQSLARQIQTALHSDTNGLYNTEPLRYLEPVGEAANEMIQAYHALKQDVDSASNTNTGTHPEAQQLAAILRDLDVGVMVMNMHHQILLYNQRAVSILKQPENMGLARSADALFANRALSRQVETQLFKTPDNTIRTSLSLKAGTGSDALGAKACLVTDDKSQPTGYVLVFDDPVIDTPSAQSLTQLLSESNSAIDETEHKSFQTTPHVEVALPARPEFYDFDLFHRQPSPELGAGVLKKADFVVFDTETTGLSPSGGDEMISIAGVRIVNGRVLTGEYFNEMINPGRSVPSRSTVFHGITDEMLVDKPDIDSVLPRFERFVDDAILVAHNAAFDMKFIELKREQCQVNLNNPVLDTVLLSAWVNDHTHRHTLDDLARRYGLTIDGRHSALGDSLATAHIFCRLLDQLAARGINTLSEAISVSDKMTHIKKHQKAY